MSILKNDEITRAWLLISAPDAEPHELRCLSSEIMTMVETRVLTEEVGDKDKAMVMRADITSSEFQLVVTLSAQDRPILDQITGWVAEMVGEYGGSLLQLVVEEYNPSPATLAACYVTESEAFNPPKGKNKKGTGFNAWG